MLKETYFTVDNIGDVSDLFLKKISPVIKHAGTAGLDLKKTALLVTDMQNYFLDPDVHAFIPSARAIIPNIKKLQNLFIENNLCLIHTHHGNTKKDAGNMSKWWNKLLDRHSVDAQIIDELMTEHAIVVEKTQYDAFYKTNLEEILKNRHISQIIITGVMTHLCVEATARSAFVRDFDVYFAIDGTATYNRDFHLASLLNLAHGFASPVVTRAIEKHFEYAQ